jgi:hypothetical protein
VLEMTMDVQSWLRKQLEKASPDLLRAMVQDFAEALMGTEADALCGAAYGERSPERVNIRNGYGERPWDTRVGTIELVIPKLRAGSYFPDWLLTAAPAARPRRSRPASPRGEASTPAARERPPQESDRPRARHHPASRGGTRVDTADVLLAPRLLPGACRP